MGALYLFQIIESSFGSYSSLEEQCYRAFSWPEVNICLPEVQFNSELDIWIWRAFIFLRRIFYLESDAPCQTKLDINIWSICLVQYVWHPILTNPNPTSKSYISIKKQFDSKFSSKIKKFYAQCWNRLQAISKSAAAKDWKLLVMSKPIFGYVLIEKDIEFRFL